jgi:DNA-binding CsgD family transcriptional regulator
VKPATVRTAHALSVVEAAYALEGSDAEWLDAVLDAAQPDVDLGSGAYVFPCRVDASGLTLGPLLSHRGLSPEYVAAVREINRTAPPEVMRALRGHAIHCGGVLQFLGKSTPAITHIQEHVPGVLIDAFSLFVHDGEGDAVDVSAPATQFVNVRPGTRAVWCRVGTHLAAGWRLRKRLRARGAHPEALVHPSGAMHHAEGALRADASLRAALVEAARGVDRARTRTMREDPERALALWQGLVAGRWSLVDRWEKDGKRYLAAFRNDPKVRDPRALTPLERRVLRYVQLAASNKQIAFTLGLSVGSVAATVSQVLRKLGCRRRQELVALADPSAWHVGSVDLGEDRVAVVEAPLPATSRAHPALSSAERAVADRAAAGATNEEIARGRGVSVSTVCNQLRSVYEKLGISGRSELVRVLAAPKGAPSSSRL